MKFTRTVAALAAVVTLAACEVSEPPRELDEGERDPDRERATEVETSDDVSPGDTGS